MIVQPVTPELRRWLVEQTAAGQTREALLQSMRASGWTESSARLALHTVLGADAAPAAVAEPATAVSMPASPARNEAAGDAAPGLAVPEPLHGGSRATLAAGDRDVTVLASMRSPRVLVFGGLLSDTECDEMIELARTRLARSETVQTGTGSSEVNAARTSEGMFFDRGEFPVCARLEARIAALLGWPVENGEGLQVLRYRAGAEYKPHYDYFDPDQPGTPLLLTRGGQRVASLVCYLNTPEQGGATVFPDVGLEVAAVKGNAVFFSYDRPHPATRSLHGGAPVEAGEKWVATKWLREGRFE